MIRSFNINKITKNVIRNNSKSIGIKSLCVRVSSSSSSNTINLNTISKSRRELSTKVPFIGNNNNGNASSDSKRTIASSTTTSSSPANVQSVPSSLSENDINYFKNFLNKSHNNKDDEELVKLKLVGPREDNWYHYHYDYYYHYHHYYFYHH